jgi:hypothetical protein
MEAYIHKYCTGVPSELSRGGGGSSIHIGGPPRTLPRGEELQHVGALTGLIYRGLISKQDKLSPAIS